MENISVSVRVRPLNKQESQEFFSWKVDGNSIVQLDANTRDVDRTRDTKYGLDHVFGPEWTTAQIYEVTTQSLIRKVVAGFNSTVFAYGQTSSGKTHTMRGAPDSPGLIPLAVAEAFHLIESNMSREYLIRVSYMELYNEEVNDLLAPENTKLPIHESKENGPYVCGLREDIVTSPEQVLQLLEAGEANRHIGSTKMNEKSSRSHTVFRMVVESRSVDTESDDAGAVLVSALTLVDLAGSERVAKTGAEGIRMKEGTAINKSLLTLGNVINKLSEGALATGGHIPYRDSKLTRILQPSLGGNAKTAIICAMTPAWCHLEESHSTLRFACRAKRVINNAVVNEVLSDAAVLKRQAKEIEELKRRLGDSGLNAHVEEQINVLRAQLLRSEQEKELMRIKLQEEQVQREKAQKQVEVAKKLMFQQREDGAEAPMRKQNRRETWCPGKSAWAAPPALAAEDAPTPTQSGGEDVVVRKRSFGRFGAGGPSKSQAELSALLEEEEEEDGDVVQGPTPQRRRRERSTALSDEALDEEGEQDGEDQSELDRIMACLPSQERACLERLVQQWQGTEESLADTQRELQAARDAAAEQERKTRDGLDALEALQQQKDLLAQQSEQAKWQARQLDKKVEELAAASSASLREREALVATHEQELAAAAAKHGELAARQHQLSEERNSLKDKLKELKGELSDVRAKLEMREYEVGLREAKDATYAVELEATSTKLKEKLAELEVLRRSLQVAEDRTLEAETRARELYECNKRLEVHVGELESRKRAPLYQKKQEEELKAAVEKAQECEVRAIEAELRCKEARAETEAASKRVEVLQDELAAARQQAVRELSEAAERHAMEVQRLNLEAVLHKERHDEAVHSVEAAMQELQAARATLEETVQTRDARIATLEGDARELADRIKELEAAEAELQAYTRAAQDKIQMLEQTAEEEAAAHQQSLVSSQQAHEDALASARAGHEQALAEERAAHKQALTAVQAELSGVKESSAAKVAQLELEVRSAQERAELLVKASLDQSQEATATKAELQRQVDELSAKVQEAAGALKAKEELKEERLRNKQEVANLKAELQKLQLDSKTGAKGKDLMQKELEAAKKRLVDAEAKLRTALQDKAATLAEKGNLERQLKQFQGQKMIMEKTLEKKDALESKKRESIMVNLNKSKEQINTFEERLKMTTIELQKVQMDLTAKQSECQGLDAELQEQRTENGQLQAEVGRLAIEGTELRHRLDCLTSEHQELQGQLKTTSAELEHLREEAQQQAAKVSRLTSDLACAQRVVEERDGTVRQLQESQRATEEQHQQLHSEHASLKGHSAELQERLTAATAAAAASTEEHRQTSEQLAAAEQQLEQLRSECGALQQANGSLTRGLEASRSAAAAADDRERLLQERLEAAQQEVQQLQSTAAAHQDTAAALQTSLTHAAASAEALAAQVSDLQLELGSQQGRVQELQVQCDSLQQDNAGLSASRSAVLEEQQALQAELQAAKRQLDELSAKCGALQEANGSLQASLALAQAAAATEAGQLSEQLRASQQEVERMTAGSCEVQAAMRNAQTAAVAAAAAEELAREELADATRHAEQLKLRCDALQLAVEAAQGGLSASEADAAMAAARAEAVLHEQLADAEQRVQQLRADLSRQQLANEELQSSLGVAQTAAQQASDQCGALRKELLTAQEKAKQLQTEADGLRQAQASEPAPVGVCAEAARAETARLAAALAAEVQRAQTAEQEATAVRQQLAEVQATSAAASEPLARSSMPATGVQRLQVVHLQQEVERLSQEVTDMEFSLNEQRAASMAEQQQLAERLVATEAELSSYKGQVEQLRARCEERDARAAELLEQRSALEASLAQAQSLQQALTTDLSQQVEQREQLLRLIDELSVQVASVPAVAAPPPGTTSQGEGGTQQVPAEVAADLQRRLSEQALRVEELLQQLSRSAAAQEQLAALQEQHLAVQQQLEAARSRNELLLAEHRLMQSAAAAAPSSVQADGTAAPGCDAGSEAAAQLLETQQQLAALAEEMSDVQVRCNVAVAERSALERTMNLRVLELETANIRLVDELASLRSGGTGQPACNGAVSSAVGAQPAAAVDLAAGPQLALQHSELTAAHKALAMQVEDMQKEAEGLRAALELETEAHQASRRQVCELSAQLSEVQHQLAAAQDAAAVAAASHQQATAMLSAASSAAQDALGQQKAALQTEADRLTQELAAAKEASAAMEAELQELLDSNTLLESQVQELRSSVATLQANAAPGPSVGGQEEAAMALTVQLRESEALRSKLELQVLELTQQLSAASQQRRESAHQRAELEGALMAAGEARTKLQAELASLEASCKELREENKALEDEFRTVQEQLHAATTGSGGPTAQQLEELQTQLQVQGTRHRKAMEQVQAEVAALTKRLSDAELSGAQLEAALRAQAHAANQELESVRAAHNEAIDELELSAKQREAELNAEKLSLESQIHWLTEENQRLQELQAVGAPTAPAPSASATNALTERVAALETELRRAKRGEMKLQALLYRLRKDVEGAGGSTAAFDNLRDVRSLQYDVDMLTEKCKRFAREAQQHEQEKGRLQSIINTSQEHRAAGGIAARGNGKAGASADPGGSCAVGVLADKENMPCS